MLEDRPVFGGVHRAASTASAATADGIEPGTDPLVTGSTAVGRHRVRTGRVDEAKPGKPAPAASCTANRPTPRR